MITLTPPTRNQRPELAPCRCSNGHSCDNRTMVAAGSVLDRPDIAICRTCITDGHTPRPPAPTAEEIAKEKRQDQAHVMEWLTEQQGLWARQRLALAIAAFSPKAHSLAHPDLLTGPGAGPIRDVIRDPDRFCNVWLVGPFGTGKTDAAVALARGLAERHRRPAAILPAFRLGALATAAAGIDTNARDEIERLKNARVLVVDDYGTARMRTTLAATLADIADTRVNAGLLTIWTSNYAPAISASDVDGEVERHPHLATNESEAAAVADALDRYYDRVRMGLRIIDWNGPSHRGNAANQNAEQARRHTWWRQHRPDDLKLLTEAGCRI